MQKYKMDDGEDINLDDAPVLKEVIQKLDNKTIHNFRTKSSYLEFKMIVEICFKAMVPTQHWKRNHADLEISGMLQIADEALALILLENNYLEWQEIANGRSIDKDNRLTLYTNKGMRHNGTKKGWTCEGMKRFNTMFERLKLDRGKEESRKRETQLMEEWGSGRSGNRSNLDQDMPNLITAQEQPIITCTDFDYE